MSDENDSWLSGIGVDVQGIIGSVQQKATAVIEDVKSAGAAVFEQAQGAVSAAAGAVTGGAPAAKPAAGPKPAATGKPSSLSALKGSVGQGGTNNPDDVKAVQAALNIAVDGQCGGGTIGAIKAFQKSIGQANPDGRVDVGGATARALASGAKGAAAPTPAPNREEDDGFLGGLKKKIVGAVEDAAGAATDLGGKIVNGVTDLGGQVADGAKTLGGKVTDGGGAGGGAGAGAATNQFPSLPSIFKKDPPDGVLRRKSDGKVYWEPAALVTWGIATKSAAPTGWMEGYFDFYGLKYDPAGATEEICTFNSEGTTLDTILNTMANQAELADYTFNRGAAKAIAKRILEAQKAAPKPAIPPVVTFVNPNESPGEGDTLVRINGSGLTGITAVTFGVFPGSDITFVSDKEITVRTPEVVAGGVLPVVVTNAAGSSAGGATAPTVKFLKSARGPLKKIEFSLSVSYKPLKFLPKPGSQESIVVAGEMTFVFKGHKELFVKAQASHTLDTTTGKITNQVLGGIGGALATELTKVFTAKISVEVLKGITSEKDKGIEKTWHRQFAVEGSIGGQISYGHPDYPNFKVVLGAEASLGSHGPGITAGVGVVFVFDFVPGPKKK